MKQTLCLVDSNATDGTVDSSNAVSPTARLRWARQQDPVHAAHAAGITLRLFHIDCPIASRRHRVCRHCALTPDTAMHRFSIEGSRHRAALAPQLESSRSRPLLVRRSPSLPGSQAGMHCSCGGQVRAAAVRELGQRTARLAAGPSQPLMLRSAAGNGIGRPAPCRAAYMADTDAARGATSAGVAPMWDGRGRAEAAPSRAQPADVSGSATAQAASKCADSSDTSSALRNSASSSGLDSAGPHTQPGPSSVPAPQRSAGTDASAAAETYSGRLKPSVPESVAASHTADVESSAEVTAARVALPSMADDVAVASTSSGSMSSDSGVSAC